MPNTENYDKVFTDSLKVPSDKLNSLIFRSVSSWDSVGHMVLIAGMEEAFNIMMDTDDILDFSTYEKGKQILKKYGIEFK
jgi:acyl carrier protein